jgi:hypothetical protein
MGTTRKPEKETQMTEQELYDLLWTKMCDSKEANYAAVAAAKGPIQDWSQIPPVYQPEAYAEMAKDSGPLVSGAGAHEPLKVGTTVRIVMVSRLGDLGVNLTPEQEQEFLKGYQPTLILHEACGVDNVISSFLNR